MKKIKWLTLTPVVAMGFVPCVTSCSNVKRYEVKDYVVNLEWNQDVDSSFNILQLTDLHFSNLTDREVQFKFLQSTIDKAKELSPTGKVDLIVITGDLFDFATKEVANIIIDFFEGQKIPWSVVYGNHDEQNYFSIEWFSNRLNEICKNGGYCKYVDLLDDDVFGYGNYVINLTHNGSNVEQLVMMDSNRYTFKEYVGYDYIHQDQIDWYDRVVDEFKMNKSLTFMHIPLPEFYQNYQKALKGEDGVSFIKDATGKVRNKIAKDDKSCAPQINTGFYDHLIGIKGPKGYSGSHCQGLFIGHSHISSYCLNVPNLIGSEDYNIKLCYGIKSTDKVECDEELGGQLISLNKDGQFDLYSMINKYN